MPKIALEARSLSTLGGGVRTYTKEVISRILLGSINAEYFVYYDTNRYVGTFTGKSVKEKVVNVWHPLMRIAWDYFFLPSALKRDKIDFVHYFKPATTPFKKPRAIATMYDVIPLLYPETQTKIQLAYWNKQLPLVAKTCEHLLTISECSKKDIVERLQVSPEKITVTPLGVDARYMPATNEKKNIVKEKYKLPKDFILYLGTIEPRKNIARLVRAYNHVAKNIPQDLVLAGKWGWSFEDVEQEIARSPFRDRIKILSHVDAELLPALYSMATAFVFPSLYEGFGLPPLEAMACGTPVITSNVSSLPEVVGESALKINPLDEIALSEAMEKIVSDSVLRERLIAQGSVWVKNFNWDRTAQLTMDVYRKLLNI